MALSTHGKIMTFFLLTHPDLQSLQDVRARHQDLALEIGWTPRLFMRTIWELVRNNVIETDSLDNGIGGKNKGESR